MESKYDEQFQVVFEAIRQLLEQGSRYPLWGALRSSMKSRDGQILWGQDAQEQYDVQGWTNAAGAGMLRSSNNLIEVIRVPE